MDNSYIALIMCVISYGAIPLAIRRYVREVVGVYQLLWVTGLDGITDVARAVSTVSECLRPDRVKLVVIHEDRFKRKDAKNVKCLFFIKEFL